MDNKAFFKLNYGLYIVFSQYGDKNNGCVINTAMQVTANPAKLCVTLSKENFTTSLIQKSKSFAVSVLSSDLDMELVKKFGFESGRDTDKYKGYNWKMTSNDIKVVTDNAVAIFECEVENSVDIGTHIMFIGEVINCEVTSTNSGITYSDYHKVKNGGTPKNAPSYQEETTAKKGFRCKICGYIEEADELPEGYKCPLCKKGPEFFEKL